MATGESIHCVKDYEIAARRVLDKGLFGYLKGAANDGITYHDNERAYERYKFRPKVLQDVSRLNTSTSILGQKISIPIGVSPFSFAKMIHSSAEIGLATACKERETCFIQSNGSYYSLEEVVNSVPSALKWLQFYFYKERTITSNLIKRAEALGYKAVVFTVDAVVVGKRIEDLRNKYNPTQNRLGNYESPEVQEIMKNSAKGDDIVSFIAGQFDGAMTWKDLVWIKKQTNLPVVVKGILTDFDAREAIKHGADAIIVSNHGGRQLDGVPASVTYSNECETIDATEASCSASYLHLTSTLTNMIDALEEVVKAVNGRCEVYLDGGIRSGTDVLKALALGARAVFIARPAAWALAVNGSQGVSDVLGILKEELEMAMALCGVSSVTAIDRNIVRKYETVSHL